MQSKFGSAQEQTCSDGLDSSSWRRERETESREHSLAMSGSLVGNKRMDFSFG